MRKRKERLSGISLFVTFALALSAMGGTKVFGGNAPNRIRDCLEVLLLLVREPY